MECSAKAGRCLVSESWCNHEHFLARKSICSIQVDESLVFNENVCWFWLRAEPFLPLNHFSLFPHFLFNLPHPSFMSPPALLSPPLYIPSSLSNHNLSLISSPRWSSEVSKSQWKHHSAIFPHLILRLSFCLVWFHCSCHHHQPTLSPPASHPHVPLLSFPLSALCHLLSAKESNAARRPQRWASS